MVDPILAIHFLLGTEISDSGKRVLDQVGNFLKNIPPRRWLIRAYGQHRSESNPIGVSEKRAASEEYLVAYQNLNPPRLLPRDRAFHPVAIITERGGPDRRWR